MENIAVIAIVLIALFVVIKNLHNETRGNISNCACSSAGTCSVKDNCKSKK